MSKILTITWYNLVRMFREKSNIFFVLVFPILIVAVLGAQFGGDQTSEVGISGGGALSDRAAERLQDSGAVEVQRADSADELRTLVADQSVALGVIVPDDVEESLRAGDPVELDVVIGPGEDSAQLESVVAGAFTAESVVGEVTGQLVGASGLPVDQVEEAVTGTAGALSAIEVQRTLAGGGEADGEGYGIDQVAVGILILLTFLNTLTAGAALIQSRKLGVSRRMLATSTGVGAIVAGEGAGRWATGIFQAAYIMVVTALIFSVDWGDPVAAGLIVAVFAAVAAAAAMLVGAVMHNDEQAAGVTVMVGLGLGALGGAMFPLELFGSTMATVAKATPHAWAIEAFTDLNRNGAGVVDVLPQVGALAVFAIVLGVLASWRLRVTLTRA